MCPRHTHYFVAQIYLRLGSAYLPVLSSRSSCEMCESDAKRNEYRRELQHMLFSRRKAEIEILANSRCSKDISSSVSENQMSISSSLLEGTPEIPLIRYLVYKLTTAVAQCGNVGSNQSQD